MTQTTLLPPLPRAHHVRGMQDLDGVLGSVLSMAHQLKAQAKKGPLPALLAGRTVLLLFEKNSTRTRVSLEVGIQRLGGIVCSLDGQTSQLARGESLEDTASVLSRYGDCIVYRANDHASLTGLCDFATVPVVNALTDMEHPCQVLADWMALEQRWGDLAGRTFSYVGDGNNMAHSYLLGAAMMGMHVRICTPPGYEPDTGVVAAAKRLARAQGSSVQVLHSPQRAVRGADAVATDTWISMGDEQQTAARLEAFKGYTVDDALMKHAAPDALFLHCLPGHWGYEASHELAHGPRSLIYDEAENRMWVQMALLVHLLRDPVATT